jgi:hypothetical protein
VIRDYPLHGLRALVLTTSLISSTVGIPTQTQLLGTPPLVNDSFDSPHRVTQIDSPQSSSWTSALHRALGKPPIDLLFEVDPWRVGMAVNEAEVVSVSSSAEAPTTLQAPPRQARPPEPVQPGLSAQPAGGASVEDVPVPDADKEEEDLFGENGESKKDDKPAADHEMGHAEIEAAGVGEAAGKRSRNEDDDLSRINSEIQKVTGFEKWMQTVTAGINASSNDAWLTRMEQNNIAWDRRVGESVALALVESQKVTDEKIRVAIEESERRQQKSLDELRQLITGSARSGSGDGASSTTLPMLPRTQTQDHVPRCIEIKGFIPDWERRRDTALTDGQLLDYTNKIKVLLGTSPQSTALIENVEWDSIAAQLVYPYFTKIVLPLKSGLTREIWMRTHRAIVSCVRMDTMKLNNISPRAVLEQSLEEQALSSEVARFYDTLRRAGADTTKIRSKWLRGIANTKVDIVEQCTGFDRLLGHFSTATASWALCGANLTRLIVDFREENFMMWLK